MTERFTCKYLANEKVACDSHIAANLINDQVGGYLTVFSFLTAL